MGGVCDEFLAEDGKVHTVVLKSGEKLPCGVVVIGAGVTPATGFIKADNAIKLERDGSVVVDSTLATGAPNLFAAGDLARFALSYWFLVTEIRYPMPFLDNKLVRIEHWGMAMTHGKIAAKNMLGRNVRGFCIFLLTTTENC